MEISGVETVGSKAPSFEIDESGHSFVLNFFGESDSI